MGAYGTGVYGTGVYGIGGSGDATPTADLPLSGSGAFTFAASVVAAATLALTGSGAYSFTASPVQSAGLPLAGSGSYSFTAEPVGGTPVRDLQLAGSGAYTFTAAPIQVTPLPLTGAGGYAFAAAPVATATFALNGAGSYSFVADAVGEIPARSLNLPGEGAFSFTASEALLPEFGDGSDDSDAIGVDYPEATPVALPFVMAYEHKVITAKAFGPVSIAHSTQPVYAVSQAERPRLRQAIFIGGVDVSYWRGCPMPEVEYDLAAPLLYGAGSLDVPAAATPFEHPGQGALSWCAIDEPVMVVRVDDTPEGPVIVGPPDYLGFVVGHDISGPTLRLEFGGEATGRAALMDKQWPIFRDSFDVGRHLWRAITDLGLRFEPRLGPTTGVELPAWGGEAYTDYIAGLCARVQDADDVWTVMPNEATGDYELTPKDLTTIHATVFTDAVHSVPDLRRDKAEEPNRVYASCVTPAGMRVRFGVYPGLEQGEPAPYPFTDGREFGPGTTNEDTDTGDGITVLTRRLWLTGFLSLADASGGYDDDCADAVTELQQQTGASTGLVTVGWMDPDLWAALWDAEETGYSLSGSHIEPAAQVTEVQRYLRSATGGVIGLNPDYDRTVVKSDTSIDMGVMKRKRARRLARKMLTPTSGHWVGSITLHLGAVLAGNVPVGASITADDLIDVRDIRPGWNLSLPQFAGGIVVHVAGVQKNAETVTLTVDTKGRDYPALIEAINRNRETRNDLARRWRGNRASMQEHDVVDVWDEVGGVLGDDITLTAGWNRVMVPVGQSGTVGSIRTRVTLDGDGIEYALMVSARPITVGQLDAITTSPLTNAGKKAIQAAADTYAIKLAKGTEAEPCGYGRGKKSDGDPLTGWLVDDGGFEYTSGLSSRVQGTVVPVDGSAGDGQPVLYLAVWVRPEDEGAILRGGRVMRQVIEGGA